MISTKKRKASHLKSNIVTNNYKLDVCSKWLEMCPELEKNNNTPFQLKKEDNNMYSFNVTDGIVRITPETLTLVQNRNEIPLTTNERIIKVTEDDIAMVFDVTDAYDSTIGPRDRCGNATKGVFLRLQPELEVGKTPPILKYGLFDDLPEMPCKLFDDEANLYDFIKHPKGRVLCKEDVENYLKSIRMYCEWRRLAYKKDNRQHFYYCGVNANVNGKVSTIDNSDQVTRWPTPKEKMKQYLESTSILSPGEINKEMNDMYRNEAMWNEMHWYRPKGFINELNKALNRCNDELFYLTIPHIRYVYSEIADRRPKENLMAIVNNKQLLLEKLIMILVEEYKCIRGEIMEGKDFQCPISMLNEGKRCYERVATSFENFIHFILEKANCRKPLQVYMSLNNRSNLHNNIESMWDPQLPERGYYGFLNGTYDFREGIFYPYPDSKFEAVDPSRVKPWDAAIDSKIVYKYFEVEFQQSVMYNRCSDNSLYDITWGTSLPIETIFKTQKWPEEDMAFHYALMGRALLPTTEDNHDMGARAVGLSRVGKTEVGKTIAYMHHDTCVRIVLGQQDSRWGMSYRGTNFVLFDEGFKLNVSSEVMKQRIDGGKQQESIPHGGMVDIHVNSMSWLNCNDGDDNTHKLFLNIEDRNGALNNRLPSFEYRYEKEAEDSELTSKIQVNVGELMDRMSQAYRIFKTMNGSWYENLSEKSLVLRSWQGRVDVGESLVKFFERYTIIAISSEDEYSTLSKYNPKVYKTGAHFNKNKVGEELWTEMHRRCGHRTTNEKILYRVPLTTLKFKYTNYLREKGKPVRNAEKVFGVGKDQTVVPSNEQKVKLWNRFKIYIKSVQSGSNHGSIVWAMGVKLK